MIASVEAVITAIGAAIAAVLGGVAAVLAASARRNAADARDQASDAKDRAGEASYQVKMHNGRTMGETLARIEADFAEHLAVVSPHLRVLGSLDEAERLVKWIRRKMEEEDHV